MAAPVTLSANTVAVNAKPGTVIGTFNADGLTLVLNPYGWFIIVGRLLATTWVGQALVETQAIRVRGTDGNVTPFTIIIHAPASVPPPTLVMSLTPATPTISDNAPAGAVVANIALSWSDGTPYTGPAPAMTTSSALFVVSGMQIVTARALTPADDTEAGKPDVVTITAQTPRGQIALATMRMR